MTGDGTRRRFLCLWLPFFATERSKRAGVVPVNLKPGTGVVTLKRVSNTAYLAAVDPYAVQAGLRPGMTLASARAIHPDLVTLPMEAIADRAALVDLGLWADRFTPLVALDGEDGLMLDVTGCTALFGGEESLMSLALQGLHDQGFTAHAALASSSGAAAMLARYAPLESKALPRLRVPPEASLADVLGPLPVAALQAASLAFGPEAPYALAPDTLAPDALVLDALVLDALARVGLRQISDVLPLPRASLAARFGRALPQALDRALGHAPRPIDPRPMPRPYRIRLRFPDPIGDMLDVEAGLHRLLARLCTRLESEGRGGRRFVWRLSRADGSAQSLDIGTARPVRDPGLLFRLFAEKIDSVDPGYGIDSMMLAAPMVEDFGADQSAMVLAGQAAQFGESFGNSAVERAPALQDRALTTVLDRLANRLGSDQVFRLTPFDSHLPDRVQIRAPVLTRTGISKARPWPKTPPRPSKLFHRACPIEPLARAPRNAKESLKQNREGSPNGSLKETIKERPADLSAPIAFRIFGRRTLLRILLGPERIAPEWWRGPGQAGTAASDWKEGPRDYFDVEDETGRRFWIYRTPVTAPAPQQRWFLHGIF